MTVPDERFRFELYRIVVTDDPQLTLFDDGLTFARADKDIAQILDHATSPQFVYSQVTPSSEYEWVLRDFGSNSIQRMAFLSVNLAKVVISQEGTIVEDEGTRDDHFEVSPHFAQVASVVFHMKRHIAIVERRSRVTTSGAWRTAIHNILAESARSLGYRSTIEFEPIPPEEEILSAFRSFSRLTRIRLRLRLPNPEVTAASKALFEEMTTARVREYLHDMKNEQGLSQEEGGLPHAAATIAEAGYKKNKVTLEGISDGKKQKVNVGGKAVSGEWDGIKSFIRGMHSNAKTKEMRTSLPKLLDEVDRLAPPPEDE